ncbi:hypothetical protein BJF78_13525 [Pseudonocardia sp. CNS-139]|nr:hypothetical protein BJF78_13525 [Pseudonocardia sp. CNS-139]
MGRDAIAGGAALDDPQRARAAAIGEALERYCGNAVPDGLLYGSAAELAARGEAPLDPTAFALFSEEQYAARGFPFRRFTADLPVSWASGVDLHTGAPVMVPAAFTYLNTQRGLRTGEPPLVFQAYAGIAAGTDAAAAQRSALEEVIERDAVTLWWLTGAEARRIDVTGDPLLCGVLDDPACAHLTATFLDIPCALPVPVVGVFLEDRRRGVVGFGSACRSTAAAAAAKALTEALVTHSTAAELGEPDGTFWSAVRAGRLRQDPYRAFRADRGYRADFRADWRDLTVLDLNLQLYLDPVMQEEPARRLRAPRGGAVALAELPGLPGPPAGDALAGYLRMLADHGHRASAVDVTTADVARTGLRVVRVVVPGMYQNAPAAFPLLGGDRLYREPVARGWLTQPPKPGDLVREPLPFA